MTKQKHLQLSDRIQLEKALAEQKSFKAIGRLLSKDATTISKEVRRHLLFQKTGAYGKPFNDCANRFSCTQQHLCSSPGCRRKCSFCGTCYRHCPDYSKTVCQKLLSPPYVCNGCEERRKCTLEKRLYSAVEAQKEYTELLSESRSGLSLSEEEAFALDSLISPLLKNGQSIHHICANNPAEILYSEKTLYRYVQAGVFSARNLDLPRKVRYRERKKAPDSFKVDKQCRIGRTWEDFLVFRENWPDCPLVEIDSVEGSKGGKVLLTIHFVKAEFMLAFLRERNTAASVTAVFEQLFTLLGKETFQTLFPVLLGDNGSEFSDPLSLETAPDGSQRTRVFYCEPSAPQQKGAAENNHEFIRRILPKGTSFQDFTQADVNRMMNHINSYTRKKLGDHSPYEVFRFFYGQEVLDALGAVFLPPNDIILRPELLK